MRYTGFPQPRPISADPAALARRIAAHRPEAVRRICSTIAHPRSLARALPQWRPPSLVLEAPPGSPQDAELKVAVSRHRLGNEARILVEEFSGVTPAYLITLRFSGTRADADPAAAEAWARAVVPQALADAVHELSDAPARTLCWFVDRHFQPVRSPAWLLGAPRAAA